VRKVKVIKIDIDKCNGCRACEAICSAVHSSPIYSGTNPEKSRIRVTFEPVNNLYMPVLASGYTPAECAGRYTYRLKEKKYPECAFCSASCPSRDLFVDPDSGLPLKCDMCEEAELAEPACVTVCMNDALTYEEMEEEGEPAEIWGELEVGLDSLIKKYGVKAVEETITTLASD
jgi:benzoyl-CoA reductase subunit BamC